MMQTSEWVKRQNGLVAVLLDLWSKRRTAREGRVRQMEILETLSLGGKRQVMLIRCGEDRFLIGAGAEHVIAIVRVGSADDGKACVRDGEC